MNAKLFPKNETATQMVYLSLKEKIIQFEFRPGAHLDETRLAEFFKVSRTPIRNALNRLESEGLILNTPYKGCVVRELPIKELNEIWIVREMLEGYAAGIAATKLSKEDLPELEDMQDSFNKLKEETGRRKLEVHNKLDAQLHFFILRKCGNETIQNIIQNLVDKIQQIRFLASSERIEKSIHEHICIIDELKKQDSKRAKDAMVKHLLNMKKDLIAGH